MIDEDGSRFYYLTQKSLSTSTRQVSLMILSDQKYYFVYILNSINHSSKFYTGYTEDIPGRLKKHNEGGVEYTAPYKPWKIKTVISFTDRQKAIEFEKYLKTQSGRHLQRNGYSSVSSFRAKRETRLNAAKPFFNDLSGEVKRMIDEDGISLPTQLRHKTILKINQSRFEPD